MIYVNFFSFLLIIINLDTEIIIMIKCLNEFIWWSSSWRWWCKIVTWFIFTFSIINVDDDDDIRLSFARKYFIVKCIHIIIIMVWFCSKYILHKQTKHLQQPCSWSLWCFQCVLTMVDHHWIVDGWKIEKKAKK